MDAVEAAHSRIEDDPLFNAARGAVFTAAGKTELDAAIMDGATMRAGAVASVTHTRYPITLARSVMEKTPYVLLVGPGADAYTVQAGMEQEPPQLLLHGEPLAVAGEAIAERGQADSAAS